MNINRVWDFIFGSGLTEDELELEIYLETLIKSLKNGDSLFYYFDYKPEGNLNDIIEAWNIANNKKVHVWMGGLNKCGIKIWKERDLLFAQSKQGYGQNWIYL